MTQEATCEGCATSTVALMARSAGWEGSRSAAVRLQKWTVAPSARKEETMARPMPLVPPGEELGSAIVILGFVAIQPTCYENDFSFEIKMHSG